MFSLKNPRLQSGSINLPLVSCLCPTYNRLEFLPRMLACFQTQTYENRELIVLDDGNDGTDKLFENNTDPHIKYIHELPKKNHGEKMNRCCELAQGELMIVWDSDDWYSKDRIMHQVMPFGNPAITLTGTGTFYFYEYGVQNPKAWLYTVPKTIGWLMAIAFRKSLWAQHKFDPITAGADYNFIKKTPIEAQYDLNSPDLVVAAIHPNNTCKKQVGRREYQPVPWEMVQKLWEK